MADIVRGATLAVLAAILLASPVAAQGVVPAPSREELKSPSPENSPSRPAPQTSAATPKAVSVGEINWYPAPTHCSFFTPERKERFVFDDPDTWRFVFLTMVDNNPLSGNEFERGYVMANGVLRELERGKTAPDKEANVVTVWRSAGEPRIALNTRLRETGKAEGLTSFAGDMTLFWGDREASVGIVGDCGQ